MVWKNQNNGENNLVAKIVFSAISVEILAITYLTNAGVIELLGNSIKEVDVNKQIEFARQCALEILKPSKKDLEHGLEVHKNSLVFDSYGFSPSSAFDGDQLLKAINEGATPNELTDLREEMTMTRHIFSKELYAEYVEAWEASGVTCVFQNAGVERQDPLEIIKRFARFTYAGDMLRHVLNRVVLPDDVERTKKEGKHCNYLMSNGIPLPQLWNNTVDEVGLIRIFFQLGCRMMHMTYNRRNMIGDGCAEPDNAGLSEFGHAVVKEMNRVGMICDVAHTGWKTCVDVVKASTKPVVSSHSACCALKQHMRGKPDEVIRAIVDSGGYNGICCVPDFLGGSADINALLDHIDYMVKTFGADCVTIGTDHGYSSMQSAAEWKKVEGVWRGYRAGWESLWPEGSLRYDWDEKARQSFAWTNWPLFTVGLVQRGHSDEAIRKIIGGNVMRVIKQVLS